MATDLTALPGEAEVFAAATRIAPFIKRTPVITSGSLDAEFAGRLFFKCENFQASGAFKARGAFNAVLSLDAEQAAHGVATHSSGNHGAALALAAARRGIPAWVVVPTDASSFKRAAIARYGARVVDCAPGLANREAKLDELVAACGATVVHPYDDNAVIAGQGTAALELLEQVGALDVLLVPVGGGGLLSGSALVARAVCPGIQVIAAEPAGADDCWQSLQTGQRVRLEAVATIADGLHASIGERNWALISRHVDQVVRISEDEIVAAMRAAWERLKVVIEPSAALPLAAVLGGHVPVAGRRVGIIFSGGNVALDTLPALLATG
ncbi:MAG: pyridoxal-phosphate dependent enzyme [Gammaproteobacteria bacterium]